MISRHTGAAQLEFSTFLSHCCASCHIYSTTLWTAFYGSQCEKWFKIQTVPLSSLMTFWSIWDSDLHMDWMKKMFYFIRYSIANVIQIVRFFLVIPEVDFAPKMFSNRVSRLTIHLYGLTFVLLLLPRLLTTGAIFHISFCWLYVCVVSWRLLWAMRKSDL